MTATNKCSNFVGFRYSPPLHHSNIICVINTNKLLTSTNEVSNQIMAQLIQEHTELLVLAT